MKSKRKDGIKGSLLKYLALRVFFVAIQPFCDSARVSKLYVRYRLLLDKPASLLGARIRDPLGSDKKILHYLHIGKTAGNTLKYGFRNAGVLIETNRKTRFDPPKGIEELDSKQIVITHPHVVKLSDLDRSCTYMIGIRNPVSRFYSGFYSRKRRGKPKNLTKFTRAEDKSFDLFEHANDLAEALSSSDWRRRKDAQMAMVSIGHVRENLRFWFSTELLQDFPPFFVFEQEHLTEDIIAFEKATGISGVVTPKDSVTAHANDYQRTPPLSDLAKRNLTDWYRDDFEIYDYLVRTYRRERQDLNRDAH